MKTLRKALALTLSLMMLLGSLAAGEIVASAAESGECGIDGDNLTWTLDDDGKLTISGKGKMGDLSEEGAGWIDFRSQVKTVVIENGVSDIAGYAFCKCKNMTSVTIPSSVKEIGESAFESCVGLTAVTIPDSVAVLGECAFCDCSNLTAIVLPNSVKEIGAYAFSGCEKLTVVPIPASVTVIREGTFGGCTSVAAFNVDSANTKFCSVDGILFSKDKKTLISYPAAKSGTLYAVPDSVTEIAPRAFIYCTALTDITIPASVKTIGESAFGGCTGLTKIVIPDGAVSIGEGAFYECEKLAHATVPASVTEIGADAFYGCADSLVIKCAPGSAADNYAENNEITPEYYYDIMPDSFGTKDSAYKLDVTASVTINNVPAGAEVYIDGGKATASGSKYSKHLGQLDSEKTFKVEIKLNGAVVETSSFKITVDNGLFAKISSFFSNFLFNGFKWKENSISF